MSNPTLSLPQSSSTLPNLSHNDIHRIEESEIYIIITETLLNDTQTAAAVARSLRINQSLFSTCSESFVSCL
jgi:hypothetical protein